ncbi:uncharacterized protein LOC116195606 [Punica granatum]|uniref:LysM domain-containing protein n=2 Tax=Punica granatum TaxID=22663 RepID=A0A218X1Z9_PUNGR|nr:uncharacterized protein LOC116195606 [Punica granatum]XP_031380749.1 uncharacterized protein LOC116195606 [Punica granatum]XP_031380750.1 uncharacterized protein LOC116195606 [Punica granatum]OWM78726.1 hypothetical protein CDL15_Pgr002897 [Punica granatum]PKI44011.1 hypothetical protein CRG98_035596 [Punica granatum]
MSNQRAGGEGRSGGGNDPSLAKTAGFLVFSGIALSILKTLNPLNKNRTASSSESLAGSVQPTREAPPPPQPQPQPPPPPVRRPSAEPITKRHASADQFVAQSLHRTVEIAKGDTLWGLSQKYGVPVDAIKEANGLTGDTIYAGRKLIIP